MEYLRLVEQYTDAKTDISRLHELESVLLATVPILAVAGEAISDSLGVLNAVAPI